MSGQSIERKAELGAIIAKANPGWSTDELIAALRGASRESYLSAAMYTAQYEARIGSRNPLPSTSAHGIRFGSWNAAIRAAGLTNGRASRVYVSMPLGRLADDVATVMRVIGGPPSVAEYVEWRKASPSSGLASCAIIRRRFGSWPAALTAAQQILDAEPKA